MSRGEFSELHTAAFELHKAAYLGAPEGQINALLSSELIDVNRRDSKGITPLMYAVVEGHAHVARVLLDNGASVSEVGVDRSTALILAAKYGHLAVTKMLVEAGADVDAKTASARATSLHYAAEKGYLEVMRVLVEAGANPNCQKIDGSTPLFTAASRGMVGAIRVLFRAKANAQVGAQCLTQETFVPLDAAAALGHTEFVREMNECFGFERCGGETGGIGALCAAAGKQHIDVLAVMTDAGMIDTGAALTAAAECSCEESVKYLLQQKQLQNERKTATNTTAPIPVEKYVNAFDSYGRSPLLFAMGCFGMCTASKRIVRMLVDAGVDTTSILRVSGEQEGDPMFDTTPLALANRSLREKRVDDEEDTMENQLHKLEAIRRLLLQVEAVHAVSWLWPRDDVPSVSHAVGSVSRTKLTSAPLASMVPIMKRRTRRHNVLLTALNRWGDLVLIELFCDTFTAVTAWVSVCGVSRL